MPCNIGEGGSGCRGITGSNGTHGSLRTRHLCFFFQAEDGIRDLTVTGVQTCALPILLMTILGGATFVGIQVYEYIHLIEHGFVPSGVRDGSELAELVAKGVLPAATMGLYGSTFFTMTGFHGFHVTCGVISMAYLYFTKALPGKYSKQDYGGIETVGLYWHFVDLVWIILFTIVYLI